MAIYKEEVASDIVLEHMTAARRFVDGNLSAIRIYAQEGYVLYDTEEPEVQLELTDPHTGEMVAYPYRTYLSAVTIPAAFFSREGLTWKAAPRQVSDELNKMMMQ